MSKIENKSGLMIGGGIFAALASSLCCVGPLVLTVLGVSGAGFLAKFDAIRIPMIVVVAILFGYAGYVLYKKRNTCEVGSICADPKRYLLLVAGYIVGLSLAILLISSPYWVVWLFD